MKQPWHLINRAFAAVITMLMLVMAGGCDLHDPVVHVGSPSPLASESVAPAETAAPETPAPPPERTPHQTEPPSDAKPTEANGAGAYTITTNTSESQKTYYSEQPDENALRVENGAVAKLDGAVIEKRAGDASSLTDTMTHGLNAAVLARGEAKLFLLNSEILSNPLGAGGALACGGEIDFDGGNIRTMGDGSYGLAATSGGRITVREMNISTQGVNAPTIRTLDGGNISLQGGIVSSSGSNSPLLDASGIILAENVTFRASESAVAMVNAGGSVSLTDCAVSGRMGDVFNADALINPYCVALYRGAENTAEKSVFSMTRGALTAQKGDVFYVTNASAAIYLEGVSISRGEGSLLLRVSRNDGSLGWGKADSNGADCTLSANDQTLSGDIVVDELSSVSLILKGSSSYTGTVNTANTALAAKVTLEDGATWTLTGNAYLTAFSGRVSSIVANGFTVYVEGKPLTK